MDSELLQNFFQETLSASFKEAGVVGGACVPLLSQLPATEWHR